MDYRKLRVRLNKIYKKYHDPEYLGIDPLIVVRRYKKKEEIEMLALLASCLAYGRVERIILSIENVLDVAENDFLSFVDNATFAQKKRKLKSFKHRFNDGDDIAILLEVMKLVRKRYKSLEEVFISGLEDSDMMKDVMASFVGVLKGIGEEVVGSEKKGFNYLLPSPEGGSACKRLNMFFRWMIRPDDGIDFGLWKEVPSSMLIIPVDVHVAKISSALGLTNRKAADWKAAEEITSHLRILDPDDPVKYDFSMCRFGMDN